ncbi:hypothetical protein LTR17_023593 [Elasticomyces elasticus]|nr:hypothetical protein LTR17_023593 [Elasticomyces elasticus]
MAIGDEASESSDEPAPFRLLDLPPELWSRIVRSSVISHEPIVLPVCQSASRLEINMAQPPIIRTSKVLREETLPAFHANSFELLADFTTRYRVWEAPRSDVANLTAWLRSAPQLLCTGNLVIVFKLVYLRHAIKHALVRTGHKLIWSGDEDQRRFRVTAL